MLNDDNENNTSLHLGCWLLVAPYVCSPIQRMRYKSTSPRRYACFPALTLPLLPSLCPLTYPYLHPPLDILVLLA